MEWFEKLPPECPPKDAYPPEGEQFFRLSHDPPNDDDFLSLRRLFPNNTYRVSECIARAISVFSSKDSCLEIQKLPTHRNQILIALTLRSDDGVILKTFRQDHYSWWRSRTFVIKIDAIYKA
jgi:hypothetical protein